MDSSYRCTVHLEEMIEWSTTNRDSVQYNWTEYHLSVVRGFVSKLSLNSSDLKPKVWNSAKLFKDAFWSCFPRIDTSSSAPTTEDARIEASSVEDLQKFFKVPKQTQLFVRDDTLKHNELVAAFINILLLLLHRREGSIIQSVEDRIDRLEEDLRFLLTVLGDKSLIYGEYKLVQNLLAKIEAVANEAGCLVHSVVFTTFADPIDERLRVLLKHMDLLKANIINFSNLQSVIAKTNLTPNTAAMDSLFIINSLLYDLDNLLKREDDMPAHVKDLIKEVQQDLKFLQSFVKDIKVSRLSEMEEYLKEPVMRIRDVAYEAEYLINSFLVGDAPLSYFSSRFSCVLHKIKLAATKKEEIKKNYDNTGATKDAAKNFSAQLSLRNKSSEIDNIIVGFDSQAIEILEHLEGGKEDLQLISIFGMPGLGKTTLAKKLYNHPIVEHRFDRRSWCVVSQTYHRRNLLIDILVILERELDKYIIQNMEDEELAEHIYKSLKGRRYLIVMDDIWSSDAWYSLQRCFPDDGNGSRILFTSRNKDVAPSGRTIYYKISPMSDEQCWELLEKKVFKNEPCPPQFLETGKNIAAKCNGVPLVVVVVAGIISSIDWEGSTRKIEEGNLASYIFSDQDNSVMQILELSYKHLPDHLKACFLYFGSFPEDREIPVQKLKWLWMAEGFVHEEERKKAEDVAEQYLTELIDKSLVIVGQGRADGGVKTCVMHDLLRDLCLIISKEENFLKLVDKNYSIYEKHQRLCLRLSDPHISLPFGLHVRSLFGLPGNSASNILNMKLLRVLDLLETKGYSGNMNEIKLLVHLRYLAINYVPLSMGSLTLIRSLVNLEFLVVGTPNASVHIPSSIVVKMMKLRYVKFTSQSYFDVDCNTSQNNNLEFLSGVIMRSNDEEMLKCSPHLRKLKCIWEVSKVNPDFSFYTQLESLNLTLQSTYRMTDMSLPSNIRKLSLRCLFWRWEKMSIIGRLPNLQVLKLSLNAFVGKTWETRDGEFQQLTFLKLEWFNVNQWNVPSSEHFPRLRRLVLDSCRFLQEIPYEIGEIVTLQLIEIEGWCQK